MLAAVIPTTWRNHVAWTTVMQSLTHSTITQGLLAPSAGRSAVRHHTSTGAGLNMALCLSSRIREHEPKNVPQEKREGKRRDSRTHTRGGFEQTEEAGGGDQIREVGGPQGAKEPEWGAACPLVTPMAHGALLPPGVLEADLIPPEAIPRRVGICGGILSVLTPKVPSGSWADQLPSGHQELYQKSMQVLDLLLQAFISENESTDEICFLLQVRAPSAHPTPGHTQGASHK